MNLWPFLILSEASRAGQLLTWDGWMKYPGVIPPATAKSFYSNPEAALKLSKIDFTPVVISQYFSRLDSPGLMPCTDKSASAALITYYNTWKMYDSLHMQIFRH